MDSSISDGAGTGAIDLSRMTEKEKAELQQFVVNETQKAKIAHCQYQRPINLYREPTLIPCLVIVSYYTHSVRRYRTMIADNPSNTQPF